MMKSLLDKSVDLIRDRFGFYHAGIFLIDGLREYALLRVRQQARQVSRW